MDIEYHFYITYIIALRAGFDRVTAYKIAYSSQYTDDNNREGLIINRGMADEYEVYISQTMDIFKPREYRLRIYPIFHFFPGTPEETLRLSARRCDGKLHLLNTTPCNSNVLRLLKSALKTNNPYRIGIATHTFVDTFAHQNFVGFKEDFNGMKGILEKIIPDIGHADAKHKPDWPALRWRDERLISRCRDIDNKKRFLEASGRLFELYRLHLRPDITMQRLAREGKALVDEVDKAIGGYDRNNRNRDRRINRYKDLIGDDLVEDYDKNSWFRVAVRIEERRFVREYFWKEDYKKSDWYRFQQAVKAHQREAKKILRPLLEQMEITKLDNW